MTIFEALEYGAIIYGNDDYQMFITWNGSATFNIWTPDRKDGWTNTDVFTVYNVDTLQKAERIASEWVENEIRYSDDDPE